MKELEAKVILLDKQSKNKGDLQNYKNIIQEMCELSNKYYEILAPTGYAYEVISPLIHKNDITKEKNKLEDLFDIEAAFKIILGAKLRKNEINPYDYCLESLNIDMKVLNKEADQEYSTIEKYINASFKKSPVLDKNLQNKDLSPNNTKINSILAIHAKNEDDPEKKDIFNKFHNHCMLWHGTSVKNLLGILSQGLRIAPYSADTTGSAFGEGIYFSDAFGKALDVMIIFM